MSTVTKLSKLRINYLTSQQYTEALNNGQINPNELYLTPASEGGGGGGSDVVYSRTLTSGTQIGRITVDDIEYIIYAPTPPTASTTAPSMDGTASYGSSSNYARADHVHPTDTSRVSTSTTINGKALSSNITLDASDVGALSDDVSIPSKTSDLTNDSGFITGYTETDPTVPAWAKASTKPSYNFSEIGSTPTTLSGYGITNAYTKTEIDSLVASVFRYKGAKATVSALPASGNTLGDVWHVTADGSEWAWDGTEWQELGTAVDLSEYVPVFVEASQDNYTSTSTIDNYGDGFSTSVNVINPNTRNGIGGAWINLDAYLDESNEMINAAEIGAGNNDQNLYNRITLTPTTTTIHNVVTPTANGDAVNKAYVDTAISGISGLQHILDGNATGSVRTSGSKSEGSSYTIGNNAFAEGYFTEAKGIASHAEGYTTSAIGNYSHAQGGSTTASGSYAHAEGSSTTAGNYAHAQGESTTASGQYSHAQGQGTTAQRFAQHTFGTYNILDTAGAGNSVKGNYIQIVGNGTSSARSNARTLDWSGNETLAGKLTLGANATAAMDAVTYQQLQERTPVTLCTYSSSPQGDGTETQFQITHGLNTTNVFVSVNITDTNGTYIAPLTSVQASAEIGYRVKIINANKIEVTFTAAPGTGAAVINVFAGISNYINADNVSY